MLARARALSHLLGKELFYLLVSALGQQNAFSLGQPTGYLFECLLLNLLPLNINGHVGLPWPVLCCGVP
jgi:hypothetical protein